MEKEAFIWHIVVVAVVVGFVVVGGGLVVIGFGL